MSKGTIKIKRSLVALLVAAGVSAGGYTLVKTADSYVEGDSFLSFNIDNEAIDAKFKEYFGFITGDEEKETPTMPVESEQVQEPEVINSEQPSEQPIEQPEETKEPLLEEVQPEEEEQLPEVREPKSTYGIKLKSNAVLNMRLNSSENGFIIGSLPKNTVVEGIYSTGEWELIQFEDKIAYVKSEYTEEYNLESGNQEKYQNYNDLVYSEEGATLRAKPTDEASQIVSLEKDKRLTVIGKVIENGEEWYLAKSETNIGYIKASQTTSIKDTVKSLNPQIDEVKVTKIAYFKQDTPVYNANNEEIAVKNAYEFVEVIYEDGQNAVVATDGVIGKVNQDSYEVIDTALKAVDLSDQRIYYYCDNDLVFVGKCTTGHSSTPTRVGFFTPYYREKGHDFGPKHHNVVSKILWEPFNGGQGLHDAPWQKDSTFGEPGYETYHGSEGCVRLPDSVAHFIYDNTTTKDKVLVKN